MTFLEAELELLEQATLPTEEEGLTLTGRVEAAATTCCCFIGKIKVGPCMQNITMSPRGQDLLKKNL